MIKPSAKIGPEDLKKIQLEILDAFVDFCEKNGILYHLAYGTLLGAIRHKGYIPWDDDVDVAVMRADYKRIAREFNKTTTEYNFLCFENENDFPYTFGKIVRTDTIAIEGVEISYPKLGVNIDIFPIDGFPNNRFLRWVSLKIMYLYKMILNAKLIMINKERSNLKNKIIKILKILLFFIDYKKIIKNIIALAQKPDSKNNKFIGISVGVYNEKEVMPVYFYQGVTKAFFEGKQYNIPLRYHDILTQLYGDYMKMPKEEDRQSTHGFEAYFKE